MATGRIHDLRKKLDRLIKEQTKVVKALQKEVALLAPPPRKIRRFRRRVKKIVRR